MNSTPNSVMLELLVDYAAGALSSERQRIVADHLASCSECRSKLRALRQPPKLPMPRPECLPQAGLTLSD